MRPFRDLSCGRPGRSSRPRRDRGASLVISLMVLTALTVIVAGFAASQRVAAQGAARRMEKVRARQMAESGLARALAELAVQTTDVPATLLDPWAVLGEYGGERFVVGRDSFRIEILDAGSFVNLNSASQDQLLRLPLTTEQVDSLLDWREGELQPRPEGAKDEYYTQLPNPYLTAMRPLLSFDELLLVKGFSVATLYEPPTEEQPNPFYVPGTQEEQLSLYDLATVESQAPVSGINGVNKTNINNANVNQIAQAIGSQPVAQAIVTRRNTVGTFVRIGDALLVPGVTPDIAGRILDNFVVGGGQAASGKINLNTAPEAVLASVPGMTQDIAAAIVSRQSAGFQSLGELSTVPGMTVPVLAQTADAFTVASSMFLVRVLGTAGRTTVPLQAVVVLEDAGPRVIKRIEPPFFDMANYWRWTPETTADVIVWERP
jgi:type II secretory pathway component PulK